MGMVWSRKCTCVILLAHNVKLILFTYCFISFITTIQRLSGWKGLIEEVEMDIKRLAKRNLGRDDR